MGDRIRWLDRICTIGYTTIVGVIEDEPRGEWLAFGCMNDWQDVDLGRFVSRAKAKDAVSNWVENNL